MYYINQLKYLFFIRGFLEINYMNKITNLLTYNNFMNIYSCVLLFIAVALHSDPFMHGMVAAQRSSLDINHFHIIKTTDV
jgi:hypothetical protein